MHRTFESWSCAAYLVVLPGLVREWQITSWKILSQATLGSRNIRVEKISWERRDGNIFSIGVFVEIILAIANSYGLLKMHHTAVFKRVANICDAQWAHWAVDLRLKRRSGLSRGDDMPVIKRASWAPGV